jgi:hypothetical protein
MSGIFPQINIPIDTIIQQTIQSNTLPMFKEYAWDFKNNDFLLQDGKFVIVEGKEALKIWIWKALNTARYRYLAYTWNYGNELESLIGKGLSRSAVKSEAQRYIEESLSINSYITAVTNVSFSQDGSKFKISFTANTVYGEVDIVV